MAYRFRCRRSSFSLSRPASKRAAHDIHHVGVVTDLPPPRESATVFKCPANVGELDQQICHPSPEVVQAVEQCPGPITVLGAGGKMGYHVCRMLQLALTQLGREGDLLAVSRFGSSGAESKFTDVGITTRASDLSDPAQVKKVPATPNVFFLAGIKFGTSARSDLLRRMNEEMPRLVADHFVGSRTVVMSTGCVYSFTDPASGGSTELDPTDPPGEYAQSCLARERAFTTASTRDGTPTVLVRLNYSIDLRYGVLVDLAQQLLHDKPIHLDTGYVNVIWQGDAVQQIIRCLPSGVSPPRVLNVTGPETFAVRDLADRLANRMGKVAQFKGSEAPRCWLNNSKLATEMYGVPKVSIDQMIEWTADWITRGGPTLNKPTHFQNRDGNY